MTAKENRRQTAQGRLREVANDRFVELHLAETSLG